MQAVANLPVVGGYAIAARLLSWAEREKPWAGVAWHFDSASFLLGLFTGVALVIAVEIWFTTKWFLLAWIERKPSAPVEPVARPRQLYRLC